MYGTQRLFVYQALTLMHTDGVATPVCSRAVTEWYNEVNAFDFNNMDAQRSGNFMAIGCVNYAVVHSCDTPCRHFTQLVWRATTQVGCAVALCPAASVVVCHYSAPGNGDNWPGNIGLLKAT